jgi:hypothetical protein
MATIILPNTLTGQALAEAFIAAAVKGDEIRAAKKSSEETVENGETEQMRALAAASGPAGYPNIPTKVWDAALKECMKILSPEMQARIDPKTGIDKQARGNAKLAVRAGTLRMEAAIKEAPGYIKGHVDARLSNKPKKTHAVREIVRKMLGDIGKNNGGWSPEIAADTIMSKVIEEAEAENKTRGDKATKSAAEQNPVGAWLADGCGKVAGWTKAGMFATTELKNKAEALAAALDALDTAWIEATTPTPEPVAPAPVVAPPVVTDNNSAPAFPSPATVLAEAEVKKAKKAKKAKKSAAPVAPEVVAATTGTGPTTVPGIGKSEPIVEAPADTSEADLALADLIKNAQKMSGGNPAKLQQLLAIALGNG